MTLSEELDAIISLIPNINGSKNYWLVRTLSGKYYRDFVKNDYIAIEPNDVSVSDLRLIEKSLSGNELSIKEAIKSKIRDERKKEQKSDLTNRNIGLKVNQIYNFLYKLKKGDIIVIPSQNSSFISIGEITDTKLASFTEEELATIECPFALKKRIRWRKHNSRHSLDVNLYKLFTSHQTINNINKYANVIERSINDLYVLKGESHLIIEVQRKESISAKELFSLGYDLLQLIDDLGKIAGIEVSSDEVQVEINLNSLGKIDLKSKFKRTTVLMGLILLVAGGGYEDKEGHKLKTDGLPGIIKAISHYLNDQEDRELRRELLHTYKDSLHIKNPEDLNKALKQFSENKDLPK